MRWLGPVALVMSFASPAMAEPRGPPTSVGDAIMRSLGGIEVSLLRGGADVASAVRTEEGSELTVASGRARQSGYRISTYSSPGTTGFRLTPNFGFLDQRIDISDFREDLPLTGSGSGTDIGVTCATAETGELIDCNEPNTYALRMRSGFLGARGGLDIVGGRIGYEWFLSADVILNVVEYRYVNARIGRYRTSGGEFAALQSGGVGVGFGVRIPQLHAATRIAFEYMGYRDFDYADPLEFKGPVVFNEEKDVYERPRVFVSGASLTTWSFIWAFAITY
ncbi:MAG: hypothetical protein ACAI38_02360 [Myxococcota bacterium]|nr:hypothetical protein [Myxococcota bacterium]